MFFKKKCVAMILAGGQGSRLGVLTKYRAKPAVPYGGKYKIIDFPLSNCIHSGLDTVGVLTQYEPLELNAYIGTGAPWDLDNITGGAFVLPPYMKFERGEWYSGTANAIYQNIYFIDRYQPEYLLVLSGDHIYKMDYNEMIDFHVKNEADVTIAVIEVPIKEASRFGIMHTDEDLKIIDFDEKPKNPKGNLASMGVYLFSWEKLKKNLICENQEKADDFGHDIIPKMIDRGDRLYAFPFQGYWKDVGTVESLWEASMELLGDHPPMDLFDTSWRIFSRNPNKPPHFVAKGGKVKNSIVSEGCYIYGSVENSVLFPGVVVEKGAAVKDSIVMQETKIMEGSKIVKSILDEEVLIEKNCVVGGREDITVVGTAATVKEGSVLPPGKKIGPKDLTSAQTCGGVM